MLFPPAPSAHLFAPFDVLKSGSTIRAPPPAAVGPFLLSQTQPSINFYVVAAHPRAPTISYRSAHSVVGLSIWALLLRLYASCYLCFI